VQTWAQRERERESEKREREPGPGALEDVRLGDARLWRRRDAAFLLLMGHFVRPAECGLVRWNICREEDRDQQVNALQVMRSEQLGCKVNWRWRRRHEKDVNKGTYHISRAGKAGICT
jgi:hypothetical protein